MIMKVKVHIKKSKKYFIARCPQLGVTTQGRALAQAKKNLKEAVTLHMDALLDHALEPRTAIGKRTAGGK